MKAIEFLSDTINPDVFRQGFEKSKPYGKYTLIARHGMIPLSKDNKVKTSPQFRIEAMLGNQHVAWVNFEVTGNQLEAIDVFVGPNHRRKGIATAMYKFAKELGNDIQPSSKQTDLGKAFWQGNKELTEGLNYPIICVDVQPEYAHFSQQNRKTCENIIQFVNKQTGPVLMLVNAEDQGLSGDTVDSIRDYWESEIIGDNEDWYDLGNESPVDWNRFTMVDKGFGYLRGWMDQGVSDAGIIKTIRAMYQQKVQDSRMLFGGEDAPEYAGKMEKMLGYSFTPFVLSDNISVEWISIVQLKKFNGAYLVGGGRNECLREVELLMNAFNIKYKRIDTLVY